MERGKVHSADREVLSLCHVVGAEIQEWIRHHNPENLEDAVKLAEDLEDSLVSAKTGLLTASAQRSSRAPPPLFAPPSPGPGLRPPRLLTPMGNLTSPYGGQDATNRDTRPGHAHLR
ncbi:UNVERIFIED_CONTAM: hypothetical protein FKN15_059110 [Acipenser sinensis]